jgi:hypothetical protein
VLKEIAGDGVRVMEYVYLFKGMEKKVIIFFPGERCDRQCNMYILLVVP